MARVMRRCLTSFAVLALALLLAAPVLADGEPGSSQDPPGDDPFDPPGITQPTNLVVELLVDATANPRGFAWLLIR